MKTAEDAESAEGGATVEALTPDNVVIPALLSPSAVDVLLCLSGGALCGTFDFTGWAFA